MYLERYSGIQDPIWTYCYQNLWLSLINRFTGWLIDLKDDLLIFFNVFVLSYICTPCQCIWWPLNVLHDPRMTPWPQEYPQWPQIVLHLPWPLNVLHDPSKTPWPQDDFMTAGWLHDPKMPSSAPEWPLLPQNVLHDPWISSTTPEYPPRPLNILRDPWISSMTPECPP